MAKKDTKSNKKEIKKEILLLGRLKKQKKFSW